MGSVGEAASATNAPSWAGPGVLSPSKLRGLQGQYPLARPVPSGRGSCLAFDGADERLEWLLGPAEKRVGGGRPGWERIAERLLGRVEHRRQ